MQFSTPEQSATWSTGCPAEEESNNNAPITNNNLPEEPTDAIVINANNRATFANGEPEKLRPRSQLYSKPSSSQAMVTKDKKKPPALLYYYVPYAPYYHYYIGKWSKNTQCNCGFLLLFNQYYSHGVISQILGKVAREQWKVPLSLASWILYYWCSLTAAAAE